MRKKNRKRRPETAAAFCYNRNIFLKKERLQEVGKNGILYMFSCLNLSQKSGNATYESIGERP